MEKPTMMVSRENGKDVWTCPLCGEVAKAEILAINHDCRTAAQKKAKPAPKANRGEWVEFMNSCLKFGCLPLDAAHRADQSVNEMRKRGY